MGRWRYRPDDNETERSAGYFDGAWNRVKKCKECGRPLSWRYGYQNKKRSVLSHSNAAAEGNKIKKYEKGRRM